MNSVLPISQNPQANQIISDIKILDAKFRKSCDQILLLNNRIDGLQIRYDRALQANRRSFRYSLRLRLATLEGVRNMFYEHASRCADSLESLQTRLIELGGRVDLPDNLEYEPTSSNDDSSTEDADVTVDNLESLSSTVDDLIEPLISPSLVRDDTMEPFSALAVTTTPQLIQSTNLLLQSGETVPNLWSLEDSTDEVKNILKPDINFSEQNSTQNQSSSQDPTSIAAAGEQLGSISNQVGASDNVVTMTGASDHAVTVTGASDHVVTLTGANDHVVTVTGTSDHVLSVTGASDHAVTMTGASDHVVTVTGASDHAVTVTGASDHVVTMTGANDHLVTVTGVKHSDPFVIEPVDEDSADAPNWPYHKRQHMESKH